MKHHAKCHVIHSLVSQGPTGQGSRRGGRQNGACLLDPGDTDRAGAGRLKATPNGLSQNSAWQRKAEQSYYWSAVSVYNCHNPPCRRKFIVMPCSGKGPSIAETLTLRSRVIITCFGIPEVKHCGCVVWVFFSFKVFFDFEYYVNIDEVMSSVCLQYIACGGFYIAYCGFYIAYCGFYIAYC